MIFCGFIYNQFESHFLNANILFLYSIKWMVMRLDSMLASWALFCWMAQVLLERTLPIWQDLISDERNQAVEISSYFFQRWGRALSRKTCRQVYFHTICQLNCVSNACNHPTAFCILQHKYQCDRIMCSSTYSISVFTIWSTSSISQHKPCDIVHPYNEIFTSEKLKKYFYSIKMTMKYNNPSVQNKLQLAQVDKQNDPFLQWQ